MKGDFFSEFYDLQSFLGYALSRFSARQGAVIFYSEKVPCNYSHPLPLIQQKIGFLKNENTSENISVRIFSTAYERIRQIQATLLGNANLVHQRQVLNVNRFCLVRNHIIILDNIVVHELICAGD